MPTVTELVDLVCSETGLDATTGTADRAKALASLNRAYRRISMQAKRLIPAVVTIPAALDITLSAVAPGIVTLDSVYRIDGDHYVPLERTTAPRLFEGRAISGGGTPTAYAVLHGTLHLDNAETSGTVSSLSLRYSARPAVLIEGGIESAIVGVDPIYHEDLLGTLAVCYALEGYEGQEERAAYYRGLVADTMEMFKRDMVRDGGLFNPRGDDVGRWDTSAPKSAR